MQTVVETPTFLVDAKAAGLTEDERAAIVANIAADPEAGDLIVGTGGARKIRFGGKGRGKSGGYRVVTYFAARDIPVFLLALVSKGQRADLSQAERNVLRTILGSLADAYRAGATARTPSPGGGQERS
ncbi:type II toxin-antitoxin system RelE/ParE family toxin [Methylobacterium sp. NEAU 140]|uniref:type II toxin-antitoxin system RelE/ParE family toxin n=1 Tax=Methylobacterium sp. NEAU 140 TaxID=3064945 RepID=UPI0027351074|nr:type II toxin-antitoxin system RelE/ParE family toxin [Methylobacterium sp. NEAU 140]MDP4025051.1 type II toxin-antitoxin system RelE/ParE family toxin [Methylobacterium sp. NEAU 140]